MFEGQQRFIVGLDAGATDAGQSLQVNVILNWFEELTVTR